MSSPQSSVLPYGMLFTTIFRHFGLDLDYESYIQVSQPSDAIDNGSISRLGYELHGHQWVENTTRAPANIEEESIEEESNEEATMEIPPPSPTTQMNVHSCLLIASPPPSTTDVGSSSALLNWYQNLSQCLDTISLDIQQLQQDYQDDIRTLSKKQDRHFQELFV